MDEVWATAQRGMHTGDDKCRGGDASAHAHADTDALGEGGLARAEAAREHEEVSGRKDAAEVFAECARLVGVAR